MSRQAGEPTYLRWSVNQRVQHVWAMVSVTILTVTGLPLRYADLGVAQGITRALGGAEVSGMLHRAAAIALMALVVYHTAYLGWALRRYGRDLSMMPRVQDVRDLAGMIRYFAGRAPEKPRVGRYSFTEKFEYLAMLWGTLVMAGTGLVLWHPIAAVRFIPASAAPIVLELSAIVHSYEALLAAATLFTWHLYHAHLNPSTFPMNRVWLTGRLTEEEMEEEHPLELAALRKQTAPGAAETEPRSPAAPDKAPPATAAGKPQTPSASADRGPAPAEKKPEAPAPAEPAPAAAEKKPQAPAAKEGRHE